MKEELWKIFRKFTQRMKEEPVTEEMKEDFEKEIIEAVRDYDFMTTDEAIEYARENMEPVRNEGYL